MLHSKQFVAAEAVAHWVERLVSTPEITGSNPANLYLPTINCIKMKKNRRIAQFFKLQFAFSGQSFKGLTIVNYNSRVIPDLKIPHITTLEF